MTKDKEFLNDTKLELARFDIYFQKILFSELTKVIND